MLNFQNVRQWNVMMTFWKTKNDKRHDDVLRKCQSGQTSWWRFKKFTKVSKRHDDVLRNSSKWANVMMTFWEIHQSWQTSWWRFEKFTKVDKRHDDVLKMQSAQTSSLRFLQSVILLISHTSWKARRHIRFRSFLGWSRMPA